MGGCGALNMVLKLIPIWLVCLAIQISATTNTTQGPDYTDSGTNNVLHETCQDKSPQNVTRQLTTAVFALTGQLNCRYRNHSALLTNNTREVEENIKQIISSTLKVILGLQGNSGSNVLELFDVLEDLKHSDLSDHNFVRLWFSNMMVPLLPYFNDEFWISLSLQNFACESFQEIIRILNEEDTMALTQRSILQNLILNFLSRSEVAGCTKNVNGSGEWLKKNFGDFASFATLRDLERINSEFVAEKVLDQLTEKQKIELMLNGKTGVNVVIETFENLTSDSNKALEKLKNFFQTFSEFMTERNMAYVENPSVRDIMLNVTWTALVPKLGDFQPKQFKLWFVSYLIYLIPSFQRGQLLLIPANISCESYTHIIDGFMQSSVSLPHHLFAKVQANTQALRARYPHCSFPASFDCKETIVNEDTICAGVTRTNLGQVLSSNTSLQTICNYTVMEHACSQSPTVTADNLANILKCSTNVTGPSVAVWKLLFQRASPVLDAALEKFSSMAVNSSFPSLSTALEAIGEIRISSFNDTQLQNQTFIGKWFQTKVRPLLASSSRNFLICLSSNNFSCSSYQSIIPAMDSQKTSMDNQTASAVFSYFIRPFLSRNNTSDPGCRSSSPDSARWVVDNLGSFSEFATAQDLRGLNPDITIKETLSVLNPTQVAQLSLTSGALNDTDTIDKIFTRLEAGNALENVDQFLTALMTEKEPPLITDEARDIMMNRTFGVISRYFKIFNTLHWEKWFLNKLKLVLPSLSDEMLTITTQHLNCTNYRIVVRGLGTAFQPMSAENRRQLKNVMLHFLRNPANMISKPECNRGIETSADWLKENLGPFSVLCTFAELRVFNLSQAEIVASLTTSQQAELLLDPQSGALENETIVKIVLENLAKPPVDGEPAEVDKLAMFFDAFSNISAVQNRTSIDPNIRDIMLNLTFAILGPKLPQLSAREFKLWFQVYLPLLLPSIDANTFHIIPINITCDSYQQIIKGCNNVFDHLSELQTVYVFNFAQSYLSAHTSSGSSCVDSNDDDRVWFESNFAQFSTHASISELLQLKNNFKGVNVANSLTFSQLVELAATPGQLQTKEDVTKVMTAIHLKDLGSFYDGVSPNIQMNPTNYSAEVTSALLETALEKAQLSSPSVSDQDFLRWLERLNPLLDNASHTLITPLFDTVTNRTCNISQRMITLLDRKRLTLSKSTEEEIYRNIFLFLQGPTPIKCYEMGSFYIFLRNTFLSFGFPDLSMFLSLLPKDREKELLDTIPTSELSQFLSQPNVLGNANICYVYNNYNKTPKFLENEDVSNKVKMATLPCFWPSALRSKSRSEAALLFHQIRNYLPFLTKSLISSSQVQNSSCFGFQAFVSLMGNNFTYNNSEFTREDVYNSMKVYLNTSSGVKCYNASDAALNSTSWFVQNIGSFIMFVTVDDLDAFIPPSEGALFFVDPANIELLNNSAVPEDIKNHYLSLLFEYNPTYSVVSLPGSLLCSPDIPSSTFELLNNAETLQTLSRLDVYCNGTEDQERNAALASNLEAFSVETITALGSASDGLSPQQIASVPGEVLVSSLSTLGSVDTWNQEQASVGIQTMQASGYQLSSASSLTAVGSFIKGVPSETIESIPPTELLTASSDATFVNNMLSTSPAVQQVFVQKIVSVSESPTVVVQNVPDELATEIPLSQLFFTSETLDINVVNKKKWTSEQAAMFFEPLVATDFDTEQLSPEVLQGFTSTTVRKASTSKIKKLVRACRKRTGRSKVTLKESQLICMYNLLKGNLTQNFTEYPQDMLLYFNERDVEQTNCRSYISAVGAADLSVSSPILKKGEKLFSEAQRCLGINSFKLSKEEVTVLGSMSCTLNSSYIQNSDLSILENLKSCEDFSESQVAAIETLLLSGQTSYGNVATWKAKTLQDLSPLPLYLTENIWSHISFKTKKKFLKKFMPEMRKSKKDKNKLKALFKQVSSRRGKRGAGCTVGNISTIRVRDPSFPFGYDLTQFDNCLDISVLKGNLNFICEKVDDDDFHTIILRKLNEAYPSGVSDKNVQLLGSVSRSATIDDISKWNITTVDTLTALMNTDDGKWEAAKSKAIIMKYLDFPGNALGTLELNAIGSNICALDITVLKKITPENFRSAKPLNVESCSLEQKKVLYEISKTSFSAQLSILTNYYNLRKSYLGGAGLEDIIALSNQNINMDIQTFQILNPAVINILSVDEVKNLLGSNLPALKIFEDAPVIRSWINLQNQSDLNRLELNLTSSRVDPTSAPSVTSTAATAVTSNTTLSTSTAPSNSSTSAPSVTSTAATAVTSNSTLSTSNSASTITSNSSTSAPSVNSTAATAVTSNSTLSTSNSASIVTSNSSTSAPSVNSTAATGVTSNTTLSTSTSTSTASTSAPSVNSTATTGVTSNSAGSTSNSSSTAASNSSTSATMSTGSSTSNSTSDLVTTTTINATATTNSTTTSKAAECLPSFLLLITLFISVFQLFMI